MQDIKFIYCYVSDIRIHNFISYECKLYANKLKEIFSKVE